MCHNCTTHCPQEEETKTCQTKLLDGRQNEMTWKLIYRRSTILRALRRACSRIAFILSAPGIHIGQVDSKSVVLCSFSFFVGGALVEKIITVWEDFVP